MTWSSEKLRESMLLYAVTDSAWLGERSLAECVKQALAGGATFVQLREKNAPREKLEASARDLLALCHEAGVPFVVNDDVQVALSVGADGVHVGQNDAACEEARALLGPDAIVGVSVQTLGQALAAQEAGADYLGVGAIFGTPTKQDARLVSTDALREICEAVSIPVVAIGGLNLRTLPELAGMGIDGAAVVSAIFAAEDIEHATSELVGTMKALVSKR